MWLTASPSSWLNPVRHCFSAFSRSRLSGVQGSGPRSVRGGFGVSGPVIPRSRASSSSPKQRDANIPPIPRGGLPLDCASSSRSPLLAACVGGTSQAHALPSRNAYSSCSTAASRGLSVSQPFTRRNAVSNGSSGGCRRASIRAHSSFTQSARSSLSNRYASSSASGSRWCTSLAA